MGTYQVDVTLSDGVNSPISSFDIVVNPNQPPIFASSLQSQTVHVMFTQTYTLPAYSDPEGQAVSLTIQIQGTTALNSFITRTAASTVTITPTLISQIGTYTIECLLNDGFQSVSSTFVITIVNNQPPVFSSAPLAQAVAVGNQLIYPIPSFSDPEGGSVTLTVALNPSLPLPPFVIFGSNQLTISPSSNSDVGIYTLDCTLTDNF